MWGTRCRQAALAPQNSQATQTRAETWAQGQPLPRGEGAAAPAPDGAGGWWQEGVTPLRALSPTAWPHVALALSLCRGLLGCSRAPLGRGQRGSSREQAPRSRREQYQKGAGRIAHSEEVPGLGRKGGAAGAGIEEWPWAGAVAVRPALGTRPSRCLGLLLRGGFAVAVSHFALEL